MRGLEKNLTLENVNLKDNNLKDDAGQLLFEATLKNRNLISMNLEMNQLDLKYVEWIKRNLMKNQQEVRLQIVPRLIQEIEKIKAPIETYEALNEKTRRKLKKEKLRQKILKKTEYEP